MIRYIVYLKKSYFTCEDNKVVFHICISPIKFSNKFIVMNISIYRYNMSIYRNENICRYIVITVQCILTICR